MAKFVYEVPIRDDEDRALSPLCKRAQDGDRKALDELCRRASPERLARLGGGDLVGMIMQQIAASFTPEDRLMRRATETQMIAVERALAGANPPPLEALLAERAAVCWLDLHRCEMVREDRLMTGAPIPTLEFHDRRCGRAHRRFNAAIRTLATVRRLGLPPAPVTVNVTQTVEAPNPAPTPIAAILAGRN